MIGARQLHLIFPRNASVLSQSLAASLLRLLTSLGEFAGRQMTQRTVWSTMIVIVLPGSQCSASVILALVLVARRATYPQALMKPYIKGQR